MELCAGADLDVESTSLPFGSSSAPPARASFTEPGDFEEADDVEADTDARRERDERVGFLVSVASWWRERRLATCESSCSAGFGGAKAEVVGAASATSFGFGGGGGLMEDVDTGWRDRAAVEEEVGRLQPEVRLVERLELHHHAGRRDGDQLAELALQFLAGALRVHRERGGRDKEQPCGEAHRRAHAGDCTRAQRPVPKVARISG